MFKDPFHDASTPYELLGLDPATPTSEVHAALPRFMRDPRNAPRIRLAQDAVKKLKSGPSRAAVDILLYDCDLLEAAGATTGNGEWLETFSRVEVIDPRELCMDIDADSLASHVAQVKPLHMNVADLTYYDGLGALSVPPRFELG